MNRSGAIIPASASQLSSAVTSKCLRYVIAVAMPAIRKTNTIMRMMLVTFICLLLIYDDQSYSRPPYQEKELLTYLAELHNALYRENSKGQCSCLRVPCEAGPGMCLETYPTMAG